MARYPQGVTSFVPSYQAYEPDFTTMGKMLSIRQNQYDQNWDRLNQVYGSLLYGNTTHEQSQKVKDQLKNEIDFNLRRVAGLDLSREQNVQQALQVFQPFYENKNLMYDMAATKNRETAISKGMGYKNATDPNLKGLWWAGGLQAIEEKTKDFQATPYDQIRESGFNNISYTPWVDINGRAEEIAKDFGDRVTPSFSADGKWVIHTKNGEQLTEPLQELFRLRLGSDPAVQELYSTKAYLKRKNFMNERAGEYGGDPKAAEKEYLKERYDFYKQSVENRNKSLRERKSYYDNNINLLNQSIKNNTATANSASTLRDLELNRQVLQNSLDESDHALKMVQDGQNILSGSQGQNTPDYKQLETFVDSLEANQLLGNDLGLAASTFAKRNYEQTIKQNPYKVQEIAFANSKALKKMQFEHDENQRRLKNNDALTQAYYKNLVEVQKTHQYYMDENGAMSVVPIKGVNEPYSVQDPNTTPPSTDFQEAAADYNTKKFRDASQSVNEGIGLLAPLGLTEEQQKSILGDGYTFETFDKLLQETQKKGASNVWDMKRPNGESVGDISFLLADKLERMRVAIFENKDYNDLISNRETQPRLDEFEIKVQENFLDLQNMNSNLTWMNKTHAAVAEHASKSTNPSEQAYAYAYDDFGNKVGEEQYIQNLINSKAISAEAMEKFKDLARMRGRQDLIDATSEIAWEQGQYGMSVAMKFGNLLGIGTITEEGPVQWGKNILSVITENWDYPSYEDVIEAGDELWKNNNIIGKDRPIYYGTSVGEGGAGAASRTTFMNVMPNGTNSSVYKYTYGGNTVKRSIYDNVNQMDLGDSSRFLISLNGVGRSAGDKVNKDDATSDRNAGMSAISLMLNNREMAKYDEDALRVGVYGTIGYEGNKSAYTFKPGKEFIDAYTTKVDSEGNVTQAGLWSAEQGQAILTNGVSIIGDQDMFDSDVYDKYYGSSIGTHLNTQQMNDPTKPATLTYTHAPGYTQTFTKVPVSDSYEVSYTMPVFDIQQYLLSGTMPSRTTYNTQAGQGSLDQQFAQFPSQMKQFQQFNNQNAQAVRGFKDNGFTDKQIIELWNKSGGNFSGVNRY